MQGVQYDFTRSDYLKKLHFYTYLKVVNYG